MTNYKAVTVHQNILDNTFCKEVSETTASLKHLWKTGEDIRNNNQHRWGIGTTSANSDLAIKGILPHRIIDKVSGVVKPAAFNSPEEHIKSLLGKIEETRLDSLEILKKHFPNVQPKLEDVTSTILGKPCTFYPDGTHYGIVIQNGYVGEDKGMNWHFDDSARLYSTALFDVKTIKEQYSFTIAIEVPDYASFLYYPTTLSEYASAAWKEPPHPCPVHRKSGYEGYCKNPDCPFESGKYGEYETVELHPGTLALQRGRFYHRAGPSIFKEGQSRITIQYFGADIGDKILMYR